jgi:biopolymer transport protein ExbD
MSWTVRHEGSPRAIEGLTLQQVVGGLHEGLWEPTDEIRGPDDANWVAIENHPQLADTVLDIEPPPAKEVEEETRLDMNALIDVTLVLLIFFILTTSYAAMEKLLNTPDLTASNVPGLQVTEKTVKELMIKATLRQEGDRTVIKIDTKEVGQDELVPALAQFVKETRKTDLLVDYTDDVPYGTVIALHDAAKGAGISRVVTLVSKEQLMRH